LNNPQQTVYPHNGHLSIIDRAQCKASPRPQTDILTTELSRKYKGADDKLQHIKVRLKGKAQKW